jgi:aspartate/tyrosine/aromatic aminotransferase
MLNNLNPMPEDKILGLVKLYRADTRSDKIDLGVGVYKDAGGRTPIMRAVKTAEKKLWDVEDTKSYTSLIGDEGYRHMMANMVLADSVEDNRIAALHTPGGTGAIRQILELIKMTTPAATIWMSDPTWPNHVAMVNFLGMDGRNYRYIDMQTRAVDFDGMMADLAAVKAGDIVLVHGCCHNPTGANLNKTQWAALADLIEAKGAIPFVDIAYQGFGDGLQEDAWATRMLAARFPEVLIAASCSKNFGIYRERAGIVLAIARDEPTRGLTQDALSFLNRQNFSFPPDHGARLVTMILQDPTLKADWMAELEDVRLGMLTLRRKLADALQTATNSNRFGFLAEHRGMFSRLGGTPAQIEEMRVKHGIYLVGGGRMNIAGLNQETIPILARAVADVGI